MGLGGKLLKVGSKVSARLAAAIGATAGFGVFAGLGWATSGGVTDAVSGALGVEKWVVNIALILIFVIVFIVLLKYFSGSKGRQITYDQRRMYTKPKYRIKSKDRRY